MTAVNEIRFTQTFNAATTGSFPSNLGSRQAVNGAILELDVTFNRAGSFAFYFGRTGETFWTNLAPSGATTLVVRPAVFTQGATGSIAGAFHTPYNANDVIWLSVSGAASGTQTFDAFIRYR